MKISTKVRYGLRAMIDLAQRDNDKPVLIKDIADRQEVSKKYLESLLAILKTAGLVRSIRGAKGGYLLAHPSDKISVLMIKDALDGPTLFAECVESPQICNRNRFCGAHGLWSDLSRIVQKKLKEVTLKELADKTTRKERKRKVVKKK